MNKFQKINSITNQIYFLVTSSFFIGIIFTYIWSSSNHEWKFFLKNSYHSGVSIYSSIKYGINLDNSIKLEKLEFNEEFIPENKLQFYSKIPFPVKITTLSILESDKELTQASRLSLHIVSSKLKYPVAKIKSFQNLNSEEQLGKVTELISNYCTNPILFIKIDQGSWYRIDGNEVWGCKVSPKDNRLIAILFLIIFSLFIFYFIRENDAKFYDFVLNLKNNLKTNKNSMEPIRGPFELKQIKDTLDLFLKSQKEKIEKRLMVLSSISHDIGTPATKLKLRTSLIDDRELKEKLETDIDKIIEMMNGVLAYTRSEIDLEEETEISYISLIESIVFDYQDLGNKVSFIKPKYKNIGLVPSIFTGRRNRSLQLNENHHLLVKAKPLSLQRAITNLIDNALKYGRRATLFLETSSESITLIVEDEGTNVSEDLLEYLKQPFLRGQNIGITKGTGLGLTIVSTIAEQHGGKLSFEKSKVGIKAKFTILRK
jgi:signal transduction histidine kinase